MKSYPNSFGFSVSHTTRSPRPNEEDGVHYNFTTRDVMQQSIEDGKFVEYADVHGNLYGTSFDSVQAIREAGKVCILDIDVQVRPSEESAEASNASLKIVSSPSLLPPFPVLCENNNVQLLPLSRCPSSL